MAELQLKEFKDGIEDQQDELNEIKKMYKSEELTSATADMPELVMTADAPSSSSAIASASCVRVGLPLRV